MTSSAENDLGCAGVPRPFRRSNAVLVPIVPSAFRGRSDAFEQSGARAFRPFRVSVGHPVGTVAWSRSSWRDCLTSIIKRRTAEHGPRCRDPPAGL